MPKRVSLVALEENGEVGTRQWKVAVVLGHVARVREPDGRPIATVALVIGYITTIGYGLFLAAAAILAASFADSNWQF